jgi:hypothetical protein
VEAKPKQTPTAKKKAGERSKKAVNGFITSQPANVAAQAGRADGVRLQTEARTRPCLQPDGSPLWAVSYESDALRESEDDPDELE